MAITKLGQASHNELNDVRQKHFDLDIRLSEILAMTNLEIKQALIARLPGMIDEIKAELMARESDI